MTEHLDELDRIKQAYSTTCRLEPVDRANTWHPCHPVSIYYRQARERALIALFNNTAITLETARILDVGCGYGDLLRFLMSLGAHPDRLHGLDLMLHRVKWARKLSPPRMKLHVGNAIVLPYADQVFDLVSQFTVFSSVFSSELRKHMAAEMVRVVRPGGCILWYDIRHASSETTMGIELPEIKQLFPSCAVFTLGRLHPRGASRVARRSLFLCEIWSHIVWRAKTHYLIVLQKNS